MEEEQVLYKMNLLGDHTLADIPKTAGFAYKPLRYSVMREMDHDRFNPWPLNRIKILLEWFLYKVTSPQKRHSRYKRPANSLYNDPNRGYCSEENQDESKPDEQPRT